MGMSGKRRIAETFFEVGQEGKGDVEGIRIAWA